MGGTAGVVTPGQSDPPFGRVGIVGLGLIGGSIAAGARRAWPGIRLVGVDRPAVAADGLARGMVDEVRERAEALADVDLIVLSAPVPEIVRAIGALDQAGRVPFVTDVGSTKRRVMAAASKARFAFVGGHPVAGAAHAGLDYARADLFQGQPWLLVPDERTTEPAVRRLETFVSGLGAVPTRTDAVTHDRVMAYVSHLPQLLANALIRTAGSAVGTDGLAASGRGFADMTRLASSPADMWRGILETNADFIAEAVEAFIAALRSTGAVVDDAGAFDEAFAQANRWFRSQNAERP